MFLKNNSNPLPTIWSSYFKGLIVLVFLINVFHPFLFSQISRRHYQMTHGNKTQSNNDYINNWQYLRKKLNIGHFEYVQVCKSTDFFCVFIKWRYSTNITYGMKRVWIWYLKYYLSYEQISEYKYKLQWKKHVHF